MTKPTRIAATIAIGAIIGSGITTNTANAATKGPCDIIKRDNRGRVVADFNADRKHPGKTSAVTIARAMIRAGWPTKTATQRNDFRKALAISFGESDGCAAAIHNNYSPRYSQDRGLWQINVQYHREFKKWNLFDPTTNAKAALRVKAKGGKNWTRLWHASTYALAPGSWHQMVAANAAAAVGVR